MFICTTADFARRLKSLKDIYDFHVFQHTALEALRKRNCNNLGKLDPDEYDPVYREIETALRRLV